ncbi:MAG TPA: hypothetical protein VEW42_04630 [Candidatus Eisenbacteria bacterium]|nr:hypothetical protein [Candidatus Eisenbacteria bacterium]
MPDPIENAKKGPTPKVSNLEILRGLARGQSPEEIAAIGGSTSKAIRERIRRNPQLHHAFENYRERVKGDRSQEARRERATGDALGVVADRRGVSKKTAQRHERAAKLPPRRPGPPKGRKQT